MLQNESYFKSEVGYGSYSMSLDCVHQRNAVQSRDMLYRGIAYEDFTSFDNDKVSAIGTNSVIQTSNRGKEWYLDGTLIASETKCDADSVLPVLCANNESNCFNTF